MAWHLLHTHTLYRAGLCGNIAIYMYIWMIIISLQYVCIRNTVITTKIAMKLETLQVHLHVHALVQYITVSTLLDLYPNIAENFGIHCPARFPPKQN